MQKIEEGKVINITDYGIFVKLNSGKKGLVHINEMPKAQKNKFKQLYKPKQIVTVKVLEELEKNRLKLSLNLQTAAKAIPKKKKTKKKVEVIAKKVEPVITTISEAEDMTPIQRQLQKLARFKTKKLSKQSKIIKPKQSSISKVPDKQLPLTGKQFEQQLSNFLIESFNRLEILSQQQTNE